MLRNTQIPLKIVFRSTTIQKKYLLGVYEKYLLLLCHSPEYAQCYEVDDAIDDTDDDRDGDQDDCGQQEGLHSLLHPVDDAEEGHDVGQGPDQAPNDAADIAVTCEDSDGVDDPQHDQEDGGVLDAEVEIKREAELLKSNSIHNRHC